MQLTDDEIRRILIEEKRKKRRQQRRRKRIILAAVALLIVAAIAAAVFFHFHGKKDENAMPRGVIFIDPGHGGSDPGSDNGERYEKDDTLKLALAVRDELEKNDFRVVMSRTEDETVERTRRGEMANECSAQLMVSLHRNKAQGEGRGIEIFIPLGESAESKMLADNIMKALVGQGFEERSVRAGTLMSSEEDYEELAVAAMPSCLVEVGFLSDEKDNKRFDSKLSGNARAIAKAIEETFAAQYEPVEDEDL